MDQKLLGSYYTPPKTIKFTYSYLTEQNKTIRSILEPSVGDGRFLDEFLNSTTYDRIVGVEIDQKKVSNLKSKRYPSSVTIVASDFLEYAQNCVDRFQLIIGNPPYINIKNMERGFLESGRNICKKLSLPESLLQNSWVAFVLASLTLLDNNGAIFFVLPIEFLQVQYAEGLRTFLEEKFNTIHIITFLERMFPDIEQEACLVYLTNEEQALPYISYKQYKELDSTTYLLESRIERNKPLKKWSNAVLSDTDIDLLKRISAEYKCIGDIATSAPGIVTAANNKFILTEDEVNQYNCKDYVIPIISKGVMARNKFEVNNALIEQLARDGKKVYLLNLANTDENALPKTLKNYLGEVAKIERNGIEIQNGYKCSKRKPWYAVPIVRSGSVIFFKRYDICPRISTNPEGIHTTDIAYNLQLNDEIEAESLVFCFYNSLTLAQCEFVGRYYAGGVSELTPNEFRSVVVPYRHIHTTDIAAVKEMFNNNKPLDLIIQFVNSKTIQLDISSDEMKLLDSIRERLISRRK